MGPKAPSNSATRTRRSICPPLRQPWALWVLQVVTALAQSRGQRSERHGSLIGSAPALRHTGPRTAESSCPPAGIHRGAQDRTLRQRRWAVGAGPGNQPLLDVPAGHEGTERRKSSHWLRQGGVLCAALEATNVDPATRIGCPWMNLGAHVSEARESAFFHRLDQVCYFSKCSGRPYVSAIISRCSPLKHVPVRCLRHHSFQPWYPIETVVKHPGTGHRSAGRPKSPRLPP